MSAEEIQNLTLLEIEKLLQANRKSLRDFPSIPYPNGYIGTELGNRLISEERAYNKEDLLDIFNKCFQTLTGMDFSSEGLSTIFLKYGSLNKFYLYEP